MKLRMSKQRRVKLLLRRLAAMALLGMVVTSAAVAAVRWGAASQRRHEHEKYWMTEEATRAVTGRLTAALDRLAALRRDPARTTVAGLRAVEGELRSLSDELGVELGAAEDYEEADQKDTFMTVCPEEYRGPLFGHPLYERGFETVACAKRRSAAGGGAERAVTVALDLTGAGGRAGRGAVRAARDRFARAAVVAAVAGPADKKALKDLFPWLEIVFYCNPLQGRIWNDLAAASRTKYVLLARGAVAFDKDINLDRMVRELERQRAAAVGGSVRSLPSGRWSQNCQQAVHRNYTLSYRAGYARSSHGCLRCDLPARGPVLAKATALAASPMDPALADGDLMWMDFFLRFQKRGLKTLVCPDVMFNVNDTDAGAGSLVVVSPSRPDVLQLAAKYGAARVRLPSDGAGNVGDRKWFEFSPAEARAVCDVAAGVALSPACLEQLTSILSLVFESCRSSESSCAVAEGTLLGAVKLGTILPWERDADVSLPSAHFYGLVADLKTKRGITIDIKDPSSCESQEHAPPVCQGGVALVSSGSWRVGLVGHREEAAQTMDAVTKVSVGRLWLPAPRNPGLYARNRYGQEIYKHAEHWMDLHKSSGWEEYRPGDSFTACPSPGGHACLDQYQTDGNLQFREDLNRLP